MSKSTNRLQEAEDRLFAAIDLEPGQKVLYYALKCEILVPLAVAAIEQLIVDRRVKRNLSDALRAVPPQPKPEDAVSSIFAAAPSSTLSTPDTPTKSDISVPVTVAKIKPNEVAVPVAVKPVIDEPKIGSRTAKLRQILQEKGPLTAHALAELSGIEALKIGALLSHDIKQGRVASSKTPGKPMTYGLTASAIETGAAASPSIEPASATKAALDVPSFVHSVRKQVRQELIDTPELENFIDAIRLEALHQRKCFGAESDEGKSAEEWFWLIGYLATKATQASRYGDREKYVHHIITCAAACLNWHANVTGTNTELRPGSQFPTLDGVQ